MVYTKQTWSDLPDRSTPITAARLNKMETQYDEAVAAATGLGANGNDVYDRFSPAAKDLGTGYQLDILNISGQYKGFNASRAPVKNEWFFYEVITYNPDYILQRATQFTGDGGGDSYYRMRDRGNWTVWRRQNPQESVYAPGETFSTLKKWLGAVSNVRAGKGHAKLLFVGDSTTVGIGTTADQAFPMQVQARLGLSLPTSQGLYTAATANGSAFWNLGAWNQVFGPGSGAIYAEPTQTASYAIYRPNIEADTIDVYWYKAVGKGTLVVNIDEVDQTPINTNSTDGEGGWKKTTYKVSVGSQHQVAFKTPTDAPVHVLGADFYVENRKTVRVANWGSSGTTAGNWVSFPYSLDGILGYAPDLTVITLGINDALNNIPFESWKADTGLIIDAALASGSVLLSSVIPSTQFQRPGGYANEAAYREAAVSLAAEKGIPFFDLFEAYGEQTDTLAPDGVHPTAQGYAKVGQAMTKAIMSL